MRLLLLAFTSLGLLSGCARSGYLLDHSIASKTAMILPDLARYGLSRGQARCVGDRLGKTLTIWQLRQLRAARGAGTVGAAAPSPGDLLRDASQVRDVEVRAVVPEAVESCGGLLADVAEVDASGAEIISGPLPAPGSSQASPAQKGAAEKAPNGPLDYVPSEELLNAIDAYERGDFVSAARLAEAAAGLGDSGAQQFLGGLYAYGRGVVVDPAAAAKWYGLAADQGWSEAMNNLGKAYESGLGVRRDPVEALKWYLLASARATEDETMVTQNMNNLLRALSTEQIEQAAALARSWEQGRKR